jgi:hypothetical protein
LKFDFSASMSSFDIDVSRRAISRFTHAPRSPVVSSEQSPTGSVYLRPRRTASPPFGPRGALSIDTPS